MEAGGEGEGGDCCEVLGGGGGHVDRKGMGGGGEIWEVLVVLVVVDGDDGGVLGRDGTVYRDRVRNLRKSRCCKGDKNIDRLDSFA